ncbi:MAG: Stp1/IreP family PP2C-type Ser/Thr phosphatase [Acutalibacteraceae bacterium]
MTSYGQTDVGCVRPNNQDTFRLGTLAQNASYAIVCDGMGGAAGGSVASNLAADMIEKRLQQGFREGISEFSLLHLMDTTLAAANALVYDESMADPELRGMGTTAVVALVYDGQAYTAHVGDSRIYSVDETIVQQTRDHSVVQDMVENGQLTPQEARHHPHKHLITRAVGVDERVAADLAVMELPPTTGLLLCSDGLTNMVSDEQILSVARSTDPPNVPARLIELAKQAGGDDNITVVWMAPKEKEE